MGFLIQRLKNIIIVELDSNLIGILNCADMDMEK